MTCQTMLDHNNVEEEGQGWKDLTGGTQLHDSVKPSVSLSAPEPELMPHTHNLSLSLSPT